MRRFEKKEKEEKMKERSGIKKTKRLCRRAEMDQEGGRGCSQEEKAIRKVILRMKRKKKEKLKEKRGTKKKSDVDAQTWE